MATQPQERTPEEIRDSIERHREEFGKAIERLQDEVRELTNWRKQLALHQRQILVAAAAAGFLLGGGLAIFSRR